MFHKAEGGIPPGSFFDGDSPQPADGAAIAEFLRQVKAMTLAQVSRVAERCEHVGYVGSQIDHYRIDLTEGARVTRLEAEARACFDWGLAIGAWTAAGGQCHSYLAENFWNTRTEGTFAEATGLMAVALLLRPVLHPDTYANIRSPWLGVIPPDWP